MCITQYRAKCCKVLFSRGPNFVSRWIATHILSILFPTLNKICLICLILSVYYGGDTFSIHRKCQLLISWCVYLSFRLIMTPLACSSKLLIQIPSKFHNHWSKPTNYVKRKAKQMIIHKTYAKIIKSETIDTLSPDNTWYDSTNNSNVYVPKWMEWERDLQPLNRTRTTAFD